MWNEFITIASHRGHTVYCVTMRYPQEEDSKFSEIRQYVRDVFFTSRKAKKKFMYDRGIHVSVWVDDTPAWILQDAIG